MPMNRIQFQQALSVRGFLNLYGTEELFEAALIARRCPRGFERPSVQNAESGQLKFVTN